MEQRIKTMIQLIDGRLLLQRIFRRGWKTNPRGLLLLCSGIIFTFGAVVFVVREQSAYAQTIQQAQTDAVDSDGESFDAETEPGSNVFPHRGSIWDLNEEERDAFFYENAEPTTSGPVASATVNAPYSLFIPAVDYRVMLSNRLGYGLASPFQIRDFPTAPELRAGWYVDWGVRLQPHRPKGMEFVQMVRVRQDMECEPKTTRDRNKCPYSTTPDGRYTYSLAQPLHRIASAARQNPGSIWLIGNEMDRRDWNGGGQDEILPELYADAYYDVYHHIKQADPTAQIAIGGIIQPTPLRLEYLTRVWDHYLYKYGSPMPVDVWNTHNFMVEEKANGFGADTPPGIGDDNTIGEYRFMRDEQGNFLLDEQGNPIPYPDFASYHLSMYYFDKQIRAYRQWMKDRGQQEKPLIVSEYGVLIPHWWLFPGTNPQYAWDDPTPVIEFMVSTFEYFLNTRDCSIGFVADDCKLVQAWNWFSLNTYYDSFNYHSALFNSETRNITPTGLEFQRFSRQNLGELAKPFPVSVSKP